MRRLFAVLTASLMFAGPALAAEAPSAVTIKAQAVRMFHKGTDAMLKKVGEEATETVMAAKDGDRQKIIYEVADLWFHTMIVLAQFGLRPADVLAELERREGLSGLEEFAARKAQLREQGEQI